MLVLGRRVNESITIGDSIKVFVVNNTGGTVRLGIEAPREIEIIRSELVDQPKDAKAA